MFRFTKTIIGIENKKVIFILNGWKGKNWQLMPIANILKFIGYCCIVYSYDKNILKPDIKETRTNILKVKKDVVEEIKSLGKQGKKEFVILGISLGSVIGVLVANETILTKLILNSVGADFAETVWTWEVVNDGFKKLLLEKQFVTLKQLKIEWMSISPVHHINNLKKTRLLIYLSKKDEIIPYEQGLDLVNKLKKKDCSLSLRTNFNFNHLISCAFNFYNVFDYAGFLKE
ncbi:hypothetical protein A2954_01985 [Candidatus Roizmanbacteria bacterium RIFCSPLOWO2_01_FULL_37_12]|uniref:Peptidase S9 prolyl oligopeptidase catalytic domain-containing protein n=1 Tax=Candidatus Roizmanbacteria bacterium RIFCSPLOWO2_01_FULL_37_12 TaxID=1802056 RepID=A0A1F7I9R7_9BACT|nr:MAG: hypothetical protein A2768_01470 [Candidatus Roizmanbacteria bacterium RIFCSPHIGHO2_01_FULL_37_16]OGK23290.1 MAG: hypothetical protein A3D76_00705 [Candidatus Roizmanbacteria bacterium RIFCSPHIGHO2_02_FULL_37_9b]OGK40062.1 MAG: hypothetical protein A2954_01985 [Candidatus Roizmanbacteria bacterium RIFCSPLOWO2_01_FULL_37_12]